MSQVASGSSFDSMKKDPKCLNQVGFNHIRKGGIGGWREILTEDQSKRLDAVYAKTIHGSGLEFYFGQ